MKLTNIHILIFFLTIYFIKQLNLDMNMLVNLSILAVVVYYYYNETNMDTGRKKHLTDFVNTEKTTTDEKLFTELDLIKTEPILEHLESLKLFAEKYGNIKNDVIQDIILHTNTFFKVRSIFYRAHINTLLEEIELILSSNKQQQSEYIEIKHKIIANLDNILELNEPVSFHQFNGDYNLY
tara:strand:- start:1900 stop:2442 length:543 start_codon:yes stop_codon:yes gene_type:complete